MPLLLASIIESSITYIVFVNMRKETVTIKEAMMVIVALVAVGMTIFAFNFRYGLIAIIANSSYIAILTVAAVIKSNNIRLALVYAIFSNIIVLLSGSLASVVVTLINIVLPDLVALGWVGIMGSPVMAIVYGAIVFAIAFSSSFIWGKLFHTRISVLDAKLQSTLASSILMGAITTLCVFFVIVFLRDILADLSMLTLAYALSLFTTFLYLVFSIFAFTESLRKDIELKHKNEMLYTLDAYARDVESIATEMRQFRHDHRNLMLGFRAHWESNDWDAFGEYYERYMGEFTASTEASEMGRDKLGRVHPPELKTILFAKFSHASAAGIKSYIEVEGDVIVKGGYNLLDACRVMGILLDNSIDACKGIDDAIIQFMASMQGDSAYFVLQNTCLTLPPMNQVSHKGFTTKEGARGLGLYNVSQVVARNRNFTLKTSFKNNCFVQEIKVAPGE